MHDFRGIGLQNWSARVHTLLSTVRLVVDVTPRGRLALPLNNLSIVCFKVTRVFGLCLLWTSRGGSYVLPLFLLFKGGTAVVDFLI